MAKEPTPTISKVSTVYELVDEILEALLAMRERQERILDLVCQLKVESGSDGNRNQ